ncbi:MAG: hypothetical protein PHT64_03955, partial [Bacteroidales bacterium]|nr:hypothetical protein [Bacteroidales bacterium]
MINDAYIRKRLVMRAILVLITFLVCGHKMYADIEVLTGSSVADSIPERIYTTQRLEVPPVIDGKLDDSCWQLGEWQGDYKQFVPVYNTAPSFPTEIKVLYNNNSLFVAIRAYDQMD